MEFYGIELNDNNLYSVSTFKEQSYEIRVNDKYEIIKKSDYIYSLIEELLIEKNHTNNYLLNQFSNFLDSKDNTKYLNENCNQIKPLLDKICIFLNEVGRRNE